MKFIRIITTHFKKTFRFFDKHFKDRKYKESSLWWRTWEKFEWELHFEVSEKFRNTIYSDEWDNISEEDKLDKLRYIIYDFPFERRREFRQSFTS